ncbi:hypothetical protein [Cohnella sp. GCM10012308]|uniref:hypothetical protein n=1 Tax=Cohnella sp. GCM10012308 TaxID=3317329 RepID=UPI0036188120
MDKSYKKVLVLSHNAFSKTQNNGKTLESFFQNWDKDKIAQIYLQPETPDFDFCKNYYRMTDYEVLNNILFKGRIGKKIILSKEDNLETLNPVIQRLYTGRNNGNERKGINNFIHKAFIARKPLFIFMREWFWKLGKWKNKELENYIEDFSPDVLFFQGSSCVFGYEICLWIREKFQIPVILELTDDYTTGLYKWSVIEKVNKKRYLDIFSYTINLASKVYTISEYMKDEYKSRFGGDYSVLMNSIPQRNVKDEQEGGNLLYTGNVSLKRWELLVDIGRSLEDLNIKYSAEYKLFIYTPTPVSPEIRKIFESISAIKYGGSLLKEELERAVSNSNILVHVEAFDEKNKAITRLSISTKIPEYMASRRTIFAVGPDDIASIKYIKENNFGKVVTTRSSAAIKQGIEELLSNKNKRRFYSDTAFQGYLNMHTPKRNQENIYITIEEACGRERHE